MAHPQQSEVELLALKEELDLAKKTIDRYTHLVTKLYDELDMLRNRVCKTCKKKFVPAAATSYAAVPPASSPRSPPLWRRVFGGRSAQPQTHAGRLRIETISDLHNAETSSVTSSTKQVSLEPTFASLPSTQPQTSAAVDNTANSSIPNPANEADWSVVHNHEVGQTLNVHMAHTLKMNSVVYRVKFSRDGRYLAVALNTGETHIYDMKTLSNRILVEHPAKQKPSVWAVQFSPDDKYIATGSSDGAIKIWNISKRHVLAMFKGHTAEVFSVYFSPDGRFLVSGSFDNSVRIWRMRDGSSKKLLDTEMSLFTSVRISPDGRFVAAANDDGRLRIWDFRNCRLLEKWKAKADPEPLWFAVFTPDGKRLLSGGIDRTLRSWDVSSLTANQSGSKRGALNGGNIDEETEHLIFRGHSTTVFSVSFLPNSRWILSGSGDFATRIWDAQTGALECILNGHQAAGTTVDASPDGHHLATGGHDSLVRIWRYELAV